MTKIQYVAQMNKVTKAFIKYGGIVTSVNKDTVIFRCMQETCTVCICNDVDCRITYGTIDILTALSQILGFGVNRDKSLFFSVGRDVDEQTIINIFTLLK